MKVLNLQCAGLHSFEGWFGSEEDYQSQRERDLVACPLCANTDIRKLPSAPRLNLGASESRHVDDSVNPSQSAGISSPALNPSAPPEVVGNVSNAEEGLPVARANPESLQLMQAAWMRMVKHVMANTEDVGKNFAEEARKMHYGESEERNIRGKASFEETQELLDEGIDVLPLPVPDALKGDLQ